MQRLFPAPVLRQKYRLLHENVSFQICCVNRFAVKGIIDGLEKYNYDKSWKLPFVDFSHRLFAKNKGLKKCRSIKICPGVALSSHAQL